MGWVIWVAMKDKTGSLCNECKLHAPHVHLDIEGMCMGGIGSKWSKTHLIELLDRDGKASECMVTATLALAPALVM